MPRNRSGMSQTNTDRYLTRAEVEQRVGLKRSAIYAMVARGDFPAPFKLGAKSVRWLESEVAAWMASRPRALGARAARARQDAA